MGQSLAFPKVRPEGLDTSPRPRYASGVAFTKVPRACGIPLLVTSPPGPLRVSFLCPTSYTPTVALPTTALSPVTPVPDRRFRAPLCPSLGSPSSTPLHASPSHLACITGWYPLARPIASLGDLLEISTLQPSLGAPPSRRNSCAAASAIRSQRIPGTSHPTRSRIPARAPSGCPLDDPGKQGPASSLATASVPPPSTAGQKPAARLH